MPSAIYSNIYSSSIAGRHKLINCSKDRCKLSSNTIKVINYLSPVMNLASMKRKGFVFKPENMTPKK
jgi:hypothetical protein